MSSNLDNDSDQAFAGCVGLLAIGIPIGMAIMGVDSSMIWLVIIVLLVVFITVMAVSSYTKSSSEETIRKLRESSAETAALSNPSVGQELDDMSVTDDSTQYIGDDDDDDDDDEWDLDDYDDLDEDVRTGAERYYGHSNRTNYHVWVSDGEFHDLKRSFKRVMRLLRTLSLDKGLREKTLGQAHDRDTIQGEYGAKDFFMTLKLLLAKDVVYAYQHFGLDTDMDFDSAEGQFLLAITLLLNEELKDEHTYKEFKRELTYDDSYTSAIRDTHDEMWQVYRDSNVHASSEEVDDFGLIIMLALVAREPKYIGEMRARLNELAENIAQVAGMSPHISLMLDELHNRVESDQRLIAELEAEEAERKPKEQAHTADVAELEQLVGLRQVKTEVAALKHFIKVNQRRKEAGMKTPTISYHCVFMGNPGTGKTTVARIVASIYKELGILQKGHLVETDRSGLVGEYIGQTAVKTNKIIDSAIDGVLFVDEAYSLVAGAKEDYGKEAIATLLKRMEDDRDRLVVILAGYEDEMKQFIESNPGLRSRFNRYIHFEDYTADELMQIFVSRMQQFDYTMDEAADTVLLHHLQQCVTEYGQGLRQCAPRPQSV